MFIKQLSTHQNSGFDPSRAGIPCRVRALTHRNFRRAEHKAQQGVTLVEVMVVVAIVAILAAIAVPSYQDMIERNRIKQAAQALTSDMQFARTEALKTSCDVIVTRTPGAAGAWSYTINPVAGCPCLATNTCTATRAISGSNFSSVVSMEVPATSAANTSTFDHRRGTVIADTVTFNTANYSAIVTFNDVGRVICNIGANPC